jgi:hypothetical protein
MAGDGGNLVRNYFFGALSNRLLLPSSSGGAAGMVRCPAGNFGCPEDASFRAFGRLKLVFEFQSVV